MHSTLQQCNSCSSYSPIGHEACLNCGATLSTSSRLEGRGSLLQRCMRGPMKVGGLALVSMTLTACYGGGDPGPGYWDRELGGDDFPSEPERVDQGVQPETDLALPDPTETCSDPALDLDEDGYCGAQDCDESDPFKHDRCPPVMMGGEPVGGASAGAEPSAGSEGGAEPSAGSVAGAEPSAGSEGGAEPSAGSVAGAEPSAGSEGGAEPTAGANSAGTQAGQDG